MELSNVVVLLILGFAGISCMKPTLINECKKGIPNAERCVLAVAERMRPKIAKGEFPEGFTVPRLDPAFIERLEVTGDSNFSAVFENVTVSGLKAFHVDKLTVHTSDHQISLVTKLDSIHLKGKYTMKSNLKMLPPVDGAGDATLELTNVKVLVRLHYFLIGKKGAKTVRFLPTEFKVMFDGDANFALTNALRGKPDQVTNEAINKMPHEILNKTKPAVQRHLSETFTTIVNHLMEDAERERK
ncbi:uncharacterized protein LOC6031298 [Culex quinquefasciatus]|uniref:uncharacterized protein LOC6031298 n=1 Tax=Culex quinquefasciatus TaxID=7176 RepID=UPI0018E3902B|nr:uncharacterized protein LOC6031298 [Culex quinquefasciatus]